MAPEPTPDEDRRYHDEAEFAAGWEAGWKHTPGDPPPPNPHTDARGKERWVLGFAAGVESRAALADARRRKIEREAAWERRLQERWNRSGRYNPSED